MPWKRCTLNNAACEGFLGRLKTEMFLARDWLSTGIEVFVTALGAWSLSYNSLRNKGSLGFRSPAQHRRHLGIAA